MTMLALPLYTDMTHTGTTKGANTHGAGEAWRRPVKRAQVNKKALRCGVLHFDALPTHMRLHCWATTRSIHREPDRLGPSMSP